MFYFCNAYMWLMVVVVSGPMISMTHPSRNVFVLHLFFVFDVCIAKSARV
jgi:hypothetical protein